MKNCQNWTKIFKETLFSEGFLNSIQFGLNLSASTHQGCLQLGLPDFLTPLAPLGRVTNGDIIALRFVFDIFVPQHHLAIFITLFRLTLDVIFNDLKFLYQFSIIWRSNTLQKRFW